MFVYSVKFICGTQNPPTTAPVCTPVRQGVYATEINIHNFQTNAPAAIQKRALLLVHNDSPLGREPGTIVAASRGLSTCRFPRSISDSGRY
jgi:hypothetical protein